jgi:signal transduction histidine kinase
VYNLVENAIKFTKQGSVDVTLIPGEDEWELKVSDTGIGIKEKFLPELFDKFKQASSGISRSFEGSGLGLALVKNLVSLLHGTITVDSEKGVGTTFYVRFPQPPVEENESLAE